MWRVASVFAVAVLTLVGGLDAQPSGRGTGDSQTVPCADPRYKAAELAAYQSLLKARAEAARALENAITDIEKRHKAKLARLNLQYQQGLNDCGDAACTRSEADKNKHWVDMALVSHDTELYEAQEKEADANEQAKKDYDKAVEDARQHYCGEEPSGEAGAKQKSAQRERIQQAVGRVSAYAATIR
jgi:hypothetical protein